MGRDYRLFLLILGCIIGIIGAITYQWILELITIVIIVLILITSDLKGWRQKDSDKSDNRPSQESIDRTNESLDSIRKELTELKKRIEILERK
jgi:hypothetical protein